MERENVATVSRLDKEAFVDRRSIVIFDFTWGGGTLAFVGYIIFTIGKDPCSNSVYPLFVMLMDRTYFFSVIRERLLSTTTRFPFPF